MVASGRFEALIAPTFTWALKPWYKKGDFELIKIIPFKAFGPYKADDAPGSNSTPSKSNSEIPTILPTAKFKPGAWLSMPSIN